MGFKVSCPACDAVLRPTKPLAPGQKVKCPKCGEGFAFQPPAPSKDVDPPKPGAKRPPMARRDVQTSVLPTVEDIDLPEAKKKPEGKSASKSSGASKRAETKTTELPQMGKKLKDDSDEIVTYAFKGDEEAVREEAKVNYALNTTIKDLRGPASTMLVPPSNHMILLGGLGFFGWLLLLAVMVWPALFPSLDEKINFTDALSFTPGLGYFILKDSPPTEGKAKSLEDEASFYTVNGFDLTATMKNSSSLAGIVIGILLGMAYSGSLAVGAVKMQNLESRTWGLTSASMLIPPINFGGILILTYLMLSFAFTGEDGEPPVVISSLALFVEWATNVALGGYTLYLLNKEEVIAGFEYVPDE